MPYYAAPTWFVLDLPCSDKEITDKFYRVQED